MQHALKIAEDLLVFTLLMIALFLAVVWQATKRLHERMNE